MASVVGEHFDILSFDHDHVLEMMEVSETDGSLLMELLDEYSQPEGADDCGTVACCMDAEIDTSCSPPEVIAGARGMQDSIHWHDGYCEDCGLDDVPSDLNGYDCSIPSPTSPCLIIEEDPLDWNEMEAAASSPSSDIGGWYLDDCMDGCGMFFGYGDVDGYSSLCMHMDNSMDGVCSSLWNELRDAQRRERK